MLTQYFPESSVIKDRLSSIVVEEIERRRQLGMETVSTANINIFLDFPDVGGEFTYIEGNPTVHLNILTEVAFTPELAKKYHQELQEMSRWFAGVKPFAVQETGNAVKGELARLLVNPEGLEHLDLSKFPPEYREQYTNSLPALREQVPTVRDYTRRVILEAKGTNLNWFRSAIRHELEHLNPEYIEVNTKLRAFVLETIAMTKRAEKGESLPSNSELRQQINQYLSQAAFAVPADEIRAHFCQYFKPETDTKDTVAGRRQDIERVIVEQYLPNEYRKTISGMVIRRMYVQAANEGREFDQNTVNYVTNTLYQGTVNPSNLPVRLDKLDKKLADGMFEEIAFWENKFREGIKFGLDRAEAFYTGKLKQAA